LKKQIASPKQMPTKKIKLQDTGRSSDFESEKKMLVKRIQKQSAQLNPSVKASQSTYLQHMKVF